MSIEPTELIEGTIMFQDTKIQAILFAITKYGTQTRRGGTVPFVVHPIRVANLIEISMMKHLSWFNGDIIIAAILHDVLEGTEVTQDELVNNFGQTVTDLVQQVTTTQDRFPILSKLPKADFQAAQVLLLSQEALSIKLADMLDNLSDKASESLIARVFKAVEALSKRSLNDLNTFLMSQVVAELNRLIPLTSQWEV